MSNKARTCWSFVALVVSLGCSPKKTAVPHVPVPAPKPEPGLKRLFHYLGKGERPDYREKGGKLNKLRKVECIDVGRKVMEGRAMTVSGGCFRIETYNRLKVGFADGTFQRSSLGYLLFWGDSRVVLEVQG